MRRYYTHEEAAELCRRLRTEAGHTQQDLADLLGYQHTTAISNAERDTSSRRAATRARIIEHYTGARVSDAICVEEP